MSSARQNKDFLQQYRIGKDIFELERDIRYHNNRLSKIESKLETENLEEKKIKKLIHEKIKLKQKIENMIHKSTYLRGKSNLPIKYY